MRLIDLEPMFLRREAANQFREVATLAEADGIRFLCPKCFAANKGSVGTHSIICWSLSVPQDTRPTPGRWALQGTGFEDLTLVAGSSSVALTGGCAAHFFVRSGQIIDC